jgi:hypothetical protein
MAPIRIIAALDYAAPIQRVAAEHQTLLSLNQIELPGSTSHGIFS